MNTKSLFSPEIKLTFRLSIENITETTEEHSKVPRNHLSGARNSKDEGDKDQHGGGGNTRGLGRAGY